ncbi:MAG TPA: hypothetical protein VEI82_11275, partial [Myxococcota bacterium]|nr:hypothetical protein [Myxococcota bacterium]
MTGDLACVLWAQHKPRDAAQLIGSLHLGEADEREIHSISHAFERAFANKPVAEVEAAFKELGAVKLSYNQLEDIID